LFLPSAIVFFNNGFRGNTQRTIEKQLFITITYTGQQFDTIIASNPSYRDWVLTHNQRVLVIRDDYDHLTAGKVAPADLVLYIESGMVSVKKSKLGRSGLILRTSELTFPKLGIYNSASTVGDILAGLNLEQTLYYGNHTGNKPIIVDNGSAIITEGDGYIQTNEIIAPVYNDLDGYLPGPSVIGLHDSTNTQLLFGEIPDNSFLQRVGNEIKGIPIGLLNIPDLLTLSLIQNVSISQMAWVDTLQCLFVATPDALGITDGIELVDGYQIQWQRVLGSSSLKWAQQPVWYINSSSGNDENDGSTGLTALKTADEIQRRWGPNPLLKQSITIYVEDDIDLLQLYARTASKEVTITIFGDAISTYTSTISLISDINAGNNTATYLNVAGVSDWNLFLNNRVNYDTINNSNAWVAKANPESLGIDTARMTVGYYFNNNPVRELPTVGTTAAIIHTFPIINHININIQAATNDGYGVSYQTVKIDSINCDGSFSVKSGESYAQVLITGCNLSCAIDVDPGKDSVKFVGCKISPTTGIIPNGSFSGCLITGSIVNIQNQYFTECLFQGVTCKSLGGTFANMTQCQIFDSPSNGLDILPGAIVNIVSGLSGHGNNNLGVNIGNGGELIYDTRPFITGASGDIRFNGSTVTWGSLSTPSGIIPSLLANFLPILGGQLQGVLDMAGNYIHNVPLPIQNKDPLTVEYLIDGYLSQDFISPGFTISSFGLNTSLQHYRGDTISGITGSISYIGGPPISANISTNYSGSTNGGDINPGSWTINNPYTSSSLAGTLKRIGTDLGADPVATFTLTENTALVSKTKVVSITFSDLIFFGVGNAGPINPTGIQSLPNAVLQPGHVGSITLSPSNQKIFYCAPQRLGNITFSLSGFPFSMLPVYTIGPVVNVNSVTTTYNVFESAQLLTGINLQLIRTS